MLTVSLKDVAWIDSTEGQFAKIEKSDPLTIDNRAKTDNNSSIKWVYDYELFSTVENERFMKAVPAIKHGVGEGYTKLKNGEYSIQIGNKIIFTDAKYGRPKISKIIEVMTSNEQAVAQIKEMIDDGISGDGRYNAAREIISLSYPDAYIYEYDAGSSTARSWFDGRDSGKERKEIVREHIQMQNGTGNPGENRGSEEVIPSKPSSQDGGFSAPQTNFSRKLDTVADENRRLVRENEKLQAANDTLRQQFTLTKGDHITDKALNMMANKLNNRAVMSFSQPGC